MGVIHFLNVKEGDCTLIQHPSNHNTVIDVSNATNVEMEIIEESFAHKGGNHRQKENPVNPIEYFNNLGIDSIFRFVLTHPDMDHMDGIKALFDSFKVYNFWDTENEKVIDENTGWGKYNKDDWDFYQDIRGNKTSPTVLHLYANSKGQFYNLNEDGSSGADGLYILAPTADLVAEANKSEDYNDCSYVILYKTSNKKIIFAGDSACKTWDYILENHETDVTDVDILLAPHHGRSTGGNDDYLDVLKPKLTLFGNAKSDYLDYASWNNRGLDFITNNQADCIILDTSGINGIDVYVTYETFAKKINPDTDNNNIYKAWYIMTV